MHEFGDAQATSQGVALLSSKLSPPRLPTALVERERLLAMLDEALSTPLTLLSAPAGFGKTTLLATWTCRRTIRVAWLSLDDLDTTPTRFWVALIVALRGSASLSPQFGNTVLALLESPQPPPLSSCLAVLLSELESRESHPAPLVLVLDDYQVIEDPAIHQSLAFFLEHLPAKVHLIFASRVDPDLPLSRLRVRGQLTEIRADELRFSLEEASQYLGQLLSPTLSEEEVQRLLSRTEGWIAGLQLAVLAMQKREDRAVYLEALTGSQRYLLDYVQQEILSRLPERVRDFLLHSAILSRLDASVCQAVTGAPTYTASQQMLVFLERNNLFLVPLDEERRSYRLHELFREALLSVLHTHHPELVPVLHRRAASFYEAQGEWHEAITHALLARDYSTAARLMEQTVEQFWVHGEAAMMVRWVLALPEALLREHARLALTTALYLLNTVTQTTRERRARVHQQAQQLMAQVETALRRAMAEIDQQISATGVGAGATSHTEGLEVRATEDALLYRRLRLLRMQIVLNEATAGEYERLSSMQQEIEEEVDRNEEAIWQIVPLAYSFVLHFAVWQEGARILPRLLAAKEQVSRSGSHFVSIKVRQYLAFAALEAGQLRLAYEVCQAALDLIEQITGYALLKGYFEIALAQVWYQWNRLEEARDLLHTALHDVAPWQHLDVLGVGYIYLVQVELARSEWSLAQQALQEMGQLVQRERFAFYPDNLLIMRAQWWLTQGQIKEASDWAARVVFPQGAWEGSLYYDAFPVVVRVYFAQQRWRQAVELLDSFSGRLDRPTNSRITIAFLAQSLVALHQAGRSEQARVVAARLFALTEPEGYLRVYLDEGEPMRQALQALLTPHSQQHELAPSTTVYISKLLAAFEQEANGASTSLEAVMAKAPSPTFAPKTAPLSPARVVSLTRREQEVLRLLAAGASNQDIAHTLVISLDTAKKHVSNLLGKLGATSRTQAVAQARARSLL
jgi:LuxR family maltose regulon positive regulatory protein